MNQNQFYLSTIDPQAGSISRQYHLGLEIAEYCTAWNMDEYYTETDSRVQNTCQGIRRRLFHAPFNELFPCAIDPKARLLARDRYRQAIQLAQKYDAEKIIIHGGYHPMIYYPQWYVEQSILFWKSFLEEEPVIPIVLENVLEETPDLLLDIIKGVDDPRLRLCLDIGHANSYSRVPVMEWLTAWAPYISHFHIHNNDSSWDTHSALDCGTIPMKELLTLAEQLCPDATYTLELPDAERSVQWLTEEKILLKGSALFMYQ